MILHSQLPDAPQLENCVLTIGTFDGVHRGHQHLVATARRAAMDRGLPLAALTFTDMPYCFFRPDDCPRLLTLAPEKAAVFERLEVDHLWLVPFDGAVAARTAGQFTSELKAFLGVQLLVVGPDFALGKGRAGDVPELRRLGEKSGFEVLVLDEKVEEENAPISSTRVRQAVEAGAVEAAARMLGRPFAFSGEVVAGRQLGRTLGVPTINLQIPARKVVPAHGVYAARAAWVGQSTPLPVALSIGTNPSVGGTSLSIEFHVIGAEIATPPKTAQVEIIARLRGQENFATVDELVLQMRRDIEQAAEILAR